MCDKKKKTKLQEAVLQARSFCNLFQIHRAVPSMAKPGFNNLGWMWTPNLKMRTPSIPSGKATAIGRALLGSKSRRVLVGHMTEMWAQGFEETRHREKSPLILQLDLCTLHIDSHRSASLTINDKPR